jgi:hypothetical protein
MSDSSSTTATRRQRRDRKEDLQRLLFRAGYLLHTVTGSKPDPKDVREWRVITLAGRCRECSGPHVTSVVRECIMGDNPHNVLAWLVRTDPFTDLDEYDDILLN